jgi:excisionase family DNA binding protein
MSQRSVSIRTSTPDDETLKMLDVLVRLEVLLEHHMVPARGFLNLKAAALYLGVPIGTVRTWMRTKRLPFYKAGKVSFKRGELDTWMDRHRTVDGPFPKEVTHVATR